ncbi:MAG: hypothetical protein FWG98_15290 [Candidatus Cloacimonetes bacterium]|nr:hypothetical protein [Candidatus Cloacimonadota bacterium]
MENMGIFNTIFNEIPVITFIVDSDVRIQFLNAEAKKIIDSSKQIYDRRGGEVLKCVFSEVNEQGCGHAEQCKNCLIRNSVNEAAEGQKTYRQQTVLRLKVDDKEILFHALITVSPFVYENKPLYILMVENVNELMILKEIIPVCSNCKKVRNDEDYWSAVDSYFNSFFNLDFSHSICPDCMDNLYPNKK